MVIVRHLFIPSINCVNSHFKPNLYNIDTEHHTIALNTVASLHDFDLCKQKAEFVIE